MGNKNYERGRSTEYKAIEQLEKVGYVATRTAGSHGTFDVIAYNALGTRFIQCKREEEKAGSYGVDIEKIQNETLPPFSTGEFWVWRDKTGWIKQDVVKLGGR